MSIIRDKYPLLSPYVLVDMSDYSIARRGTEEKIDRKEEQILSKLKDRKA